MGASLIRISECNHLTTTPSKVKLHSYSGESIPVLGTVDVCVKYGDQTAILPLLVVRGAAPSLLVGCTQIGLA